MASEPPVPPGWVAAPSRPDPSPFREDEEGFMGDDGGRDDVGNFNESGSSYQTHHESARSCRTNNENETSYQTEHETESPEQTPIDAESAHSGDVDASKKKAGVLLAFFAIFAATAVVAKKLLKLTKGGEDDVDAEVDRMNTDLQTQANTTTPMPPADP